MAGGLADSMSARSGGDRIGGPSRDGANDDHDPTDRNRPRSKLGGGGLQLPPEYADFILADGRRLEDVLGKSFFKGFGKGGKDGRDGKGGAHARMLAERRAQARRLNQTRAILTGAQGVAGPAGTARSQLSGG